jgi:hypothetical protein
MRMHMNLALKTNFAECHLSDLVDGNKVAWVLWPWT